MAKAAFNMKKTLSTCNLDSNFKEDTSEVLYLEYRVVRCWMLDTLESRSEIAQTFWNVVLEKDGEDQLNWSCVQWQSIT